MTNGHIFTHLYQLKIKQYELVNGANQGKSNNSERSSRNMDVYVVSEKSKGRHREGLATLSGDIQRAAATDRAGI